MFVKYRGVALIILLLFCACDNDFFPKGLYDYQVERLLSNDSSKVWLQRVNAENCQDLVRLFVELISEPNNDSLDISEITFSANCTPDTSIIGRADASSFDESLLFTDSLNFANGDFWIISRITSESLEITSPIGKSSYLSEF